MGYRPLELEARLGGGKPPVDVLSRRIARGDPGLDVREATHYRASRSTALPFASSNQGTREGRDCRLRPTAASRPSSPHTGFTSTENAGAMSS